MKNYYFTFGCGHLLAKFYVLIPAESFIEAREVMFSYFGAKWCFQYDEEQWFEESCSMAEKYHLMELDLNSKIAKDVSIMIKQENR